MAAGHQLLVREGTLQEFAAGLPWTVIVLTLFFIDSVSAACAAVKAAA